MSRRGHRPTPSAVVGATHKEEPPDLGGSIYSLNVVARSVLALCDEAIFQFEEIASAFTLATT